VSRLRSRSSFQSRRSIKRGGTRGRSPSRIGRFSDAFRSLLDDAAALLNESGTSDLWFDLAERLRLSARRVGSATHRLHEWAEPDDGVADLDGHIEVADQALRPEERQRRRTLRAGRRNTRLWSDSDS
jgi:hypothetical protein